LTVSQRNELVPVSPDEGAVRLSVGSRAGSSNAAASSDRLTTPSTTGDEIWLLSAVESVTGTANPDAVTQSLKSELTGVRMEDPGAVLKQTFRQLNSAMYQQGLGANTASAVALVAKGKYATIASTGDGQVYLMRAGRLNRVTRPAATPTPLKSGKQRQPQAETEPAVALLGAREKLDAKQPAIFELTLLPEDRVLLCTATVANALDEKSLIAQLAIGDISQSLAVIGTESGAAAVATIAAARERQPVLVGEPAKNSMVPIIAAVIAVLLVIAAVLAYGYL
jgi:hypothetical protein